MLERDDIKKLFTILQSHYGHRWTTTYDDPEIMRVAVDEWRRVLKGFRPDDIRTGLNLWAGDWPPTLPQFARLCLPPLGTLIPDMKSRIDQNKIDYKFCAQTASEEGLRRKYQLEADRKLHDEMKIEALSLIQERGIDAVMALACPENRNLTALK